MEREREERERERDWRRRRKPARKSNWTNVNIIDARDARVATEAKSAKSVTPGRLLPPRNVGGLPHSYLVFKSSSTFSQPAHLISPNCPALGWGSID